MKSFFQKTELKMLKKVTGNGRGFFAAGTTKQSKLTKVEKISLF